MGTEQQARVGVTSEEEMRGAICRVLLARHGWRTAGGIARELRQPSDAVLGVLESHPGVFVRSGTRPAFYRLRNDE